MAKQQESKLEYFYRVVVPKVTSFGAAVVVVGALFKIQHLPGAGEMLAVGLLTEAALFFMGVFQPAAPAESHYDWSKVYPELEGHHESKSPAKKGGDDNKNASALVAMDKMLLEAGLSGETFKNFGNGMKTLQTNVSQMKDIAGVSIASNDYTKNLELASKSVGELNKAFTTTAGAVNNIVQTSNTSLQNITKTASDAMVSMVNSTKGAMTAIANSSKDAEEYHKQIQVITKNLGALNAVYEMELKDANSHLKAMNKFYSNLTGAMESMTEANKESKQFRDQMAQLTTNLSSLNKVYGNMLAAMKG